MHHGNWCGPGWSNGKSQNSVRGTAPAIDEFDETCRQHDFSYADKGDLAAADFKFARDNLFSASVQRNVAGMAVGLQGLARHAAIIMSNPRKRLRSQPEPSSTCLAMPAPKRARVTTTTTTRAIIAPRALRNTMGVVAMPASRAAPVAYSNTIQGYKVSSNAGVTTVRGREYAAGSSGFNSAITQLTDVIIHHPSYYATTALGNLSRSFREYRWNNIRVSYIATCPTTTQGWTQIVTNPDVLDSAYKYTTNTDLLQRSMSTQNAVLGNTWENIVHDVPLKKNWCLTQPFDGVEQRDHIAGETYIYQNSTSTATLGLVIIDYEISFRDLYYTLHTSIPFAQYAPVSLVDSVTNPTANSIVQVTNTALTSGVASGTVYRLICLADQSSAGLGATLSNAWKTYTDGNTTNILSIQNGTTVYGLVISTTLKIFPTLEDAKTSSGTQFIAYGNTQSTASTYVVQAVRMCLGLSELTSQS